MRRKSSSSPRGSKRRPSGHSRDQSPSEKCTGWALVSIPSHQPVTHVELSLHTHSPRVHMTPTSTQTHTHVSPCPCPCFPCLAHTPPHTPMRTHWEPTRDRLLQAGGERALPGHAPWAPNASLLAGELMGCGPAHPGQLFMRRPLQSHRSAWCCPTSVSFRQGRVCPQ